jgi:hypothetical protein
MEVSTRRIGEAVTDGTGLQPEELGLVAVGALALAGVVVALKMVDLVNRYWTPSGGRR